MTREQIKLAAIQCGCIEGTAEYYGFIEGVSWLLTQIYCGRIRPETI